MLLILINCKRHWYPPDSPGPTGPGIEATLAIAAAMPEALAKILADIDASTGAPSVRPGQVMVNFGHLHEKAVNAKDVQVLIGVGGGDPFASPFEAALRRATIRNRMMMELARLMDDLDQAPGTYDWPDGYIEVHPQETAGLSFTRKGGSTEVLAQWGNPRIEA